MRPEIDVKSPLRSTESRSDARREAQLTSDLGDLNTTGRRECESAIIGVTLYGRERRRVPLPFPRLSPCRTFERLCARGTYADRVRRKAERNGTERSGAERSRRRRERQEKEGKSAYYFAVTFPTCVRVRVLTSVAALHPARITTAVLIRIQCILSRIFSP
jgi:hypothetical protein